jgi:hypothetical protein
MTTYISALSHEHPWGLDGFHHARGCYSYEFPAKAIGLAWETANLHDTTRHWWGIVKTLCAYGEILRYVDNFPHKREFDDNITTLYRVALQRKVQATYSPYYP